MATELTIETTDDISVRLKYRGGRQTNRVVVTCDNESDVINAFSASEIALHFKDIDALIAELPRDAIKRVCDLVEDTDE